MRRHHLWASLVVVLLVVPASAAAQSAGDNQYSDPFAHTNPPSQHAANTSAQQHQVTSGATAGAADPSDPAAKGQLPRTGLGAGLFGAVGLVLVLCGAALRVVARAPRLD